MEMLLNILSAVIFSFYILRSVIYIYLIILIFYILTKKYLIKDLNIHIFELNINLFSLLWSGLVIINDHLKEMEGLYFPKKVNEIKKKYYFKFNIILLIFIIFYFINFLLSFFSLNIINNLELLKTWFIIVVIIKLAIIFILDIRYKLPKVNIYLEDTDLILQNKLLNLLNFEGDNPSDPVDWRLRNMAKRVVEAGYYKKIGKIMGYSTFILGACATCIMSIWGLIDIHQQLYPEKAPLFMYWRLYLDPPKTKEAWENIVSTYPMLKSHPDYIDLKLNDKENLVMDISKVNKENLEKDE